MLLKNSKGWLIVLASIGLMAGAQGAALAADTDWLQSLFGSQDTGNNEDRPDQKQIEADQAATGQIQAAIQNNRNQLAQAEQQLRQDQRSGADTTADRNNIRNIHSSLSENLGRLQAHTQDLVKDGLPVTYTVPVRPDRRWENRGLYPGYGQPDPRWSGYRHEHMRHNEYHRYAAH